MCCGGPERSTFDCAPGNGSKRGGAGSRKENPDSSPTGPGCARTCGEDEKSGVTGDCHAPFRGSPGVKFPGATRLRVRRLDGPGVPDRPVRQIRRWRLHLRTGHSIGELAREINPIVRGWMQYYGAFYRTALHPLLERVNDYLMRWLRRKYRRLRALLKAKACWRRITRQYPRLFTQWAWSVSFC